MNRLGAFGKYVALILIVAVSLYPLYFMVQSSFKSNREMRSHFWGPVRKAKWDNYSHAFQRMIFDYRALSDPKVETNASPLLNTFYVAGVSVFFTLLLGALAAFGFAQYTFPLKGLLYYFVLSFLMIPGILTLVPSFVLVKDLGLFNTRWGLILPYIAGGQVIAIFLLRAYFESLPKSLFESAEMDGAGMLTQFQRIALPLSMPLLVTVALLQTIHIWNDYVWPLIIVGGKDSLHTMTIALAYYGSQYNIEFGRMMAGYIMGSLPLVILILCLLRYFLRGVMSGAIKG